MFLLARFPNSVNIAPLISRLWSKDIVNKVITQTDAMSLEECKKLGVYIYKENLASQDDFYIDIIIFDENQISIAQEILNTFVFELNNGLRQKTSYSLIKSIKSFFKKQFAITPYSLAILFFAFFVSIFVYLSPSLALDIFSLRDVSFVELNFFNTSFKLPLTWQIWRYITPIFLHEDVYSLIFSGFWVFIFAIKIEEVIKNKFALLFVLVALGINLLSFAFLDGYLAGLIPAAYGLLTFAVIQNIMFRASVYLLPNVILYFFIGLMMLGLMDISYIFGSKIHNLVNLTGVLVGAILSSFSFVDKTIQTKLKEDA